MSILGIDDIRGLASRFGVHVMDAQPADAALACVYILDDAYVLRGRHISYRLKGNIEKEQELLKEVRTYTKLQFPELLFAEEGGYALEEGQYLWTMYKLIHGRVLGNWKELGKAKDSDTRMVCRAMRLLHDQTMGKGECIGPDYAFVRDMKKKLKTTKKMIPDHCVQRIEHAFNHVDEEIKSMSSQDYVFVHGDFHHGNMIVGTGGKIVGLIDTDWCRVGHPFEDLSFLVMMCLRSYDADSFHFREEYFSQLLEWYGLHKDEHSLFVEYLLLYALFDVDLFAHEGHLSDSEYFLHYQISLLIDLCERFPLDESPPPPHMSSLEFPVDLPERYVHLAQELKVYASDIEEHFTKGGGPGGQKINKTSSCVELTHVPTSIHVRVQRHREQSRNRLAAYKTLIEKIDEKEKGKESLKAKENFKVRKQKQRRSRKAKEKVLKEKKKRSEKKQHRKRITPEPSDH